MTLDQAALAARILTQHRVYGDTRFQPASDDFGDLQPLEVIHGRVYRFPQYDASFSNEPDVSLTIYLGLGELGGTLWEQEARALTRIGSLGHPSLPEFADSGQLEPGIELDGMMLETGTGFIRTRSVGEPASQTDGGRGFADNMRGRPSDALRQFWMLADSLAVLHDARIHHRNIWPGTLEVGSGPTGALRVAFSRFEMSQMVTNLMNRRSTADVHSVRDLYLAQDMRHRLYTAPEVLRFITGTGSTLDGPPSWESDVFALGVIACEWFLGSAIPEPVDFEPGSVLAWQRDLRSSLATSVPRSLRELLHSMTDPTPRNRTETAEIASQIERNFDTILAELLGEHDEQPHVVAFMENYSDATLLEWGYISEPAASEGGRAQVEALIERDMRGARVAVSPTGATGFVMSRSASAADLEHAKTLIFGHELIWFCSVLTRRTPSGDVPVPCARVVRFVVERRVAERFTRLEDLRKAGLQRQLFAVRPIEAFSTSERMFKRLAECSPSWDELERSDNRTRAVSKEAETYLGALKWYLEYQAAQLAASTYAYRLEGTGIGTAQLRRDLGREQTRAHAATALARKFLSNPDVRLSMADHFAEAASEAGGSVELEILADHRGGPGQRRGTCRFSSTRGLEMVEVTTKPSVVIPELGWIRLRSDGAVRSNIERQTTAVSDLAARRLLLQQLVNPSGGSVLRDRWTTAGGTLQGEGRSAVQQILTHENLFALQGPPGTGKTEVTSQAVVDYLAVNPGSRILVSAQSHDALDNLAVRILRKLTVLDANGRPASTDWVALRAASDATRDRVVDILQPFDLATYAGRLVSQARERTREWLTTHRVEDRRLADILQRWLASADDALLELEWRARRGANLVFATTGASTRNRLVEEYGAAEPFDWVLVEEAAKAWPTELALPLVHGLRWTLIGDQAQIGAYQRNQVERFLLACDKDPDPDIEDWYKRREDLLRAFDTFANFFRIAGNRPRMELTEQYRMHSAISTAVSRAFYSELEGGGLRSMRPDEPHGVREPSWLQGHSLVWIDTQDVQAAEGYWTNEYEADVIAQLVRRLEPRPGRKAKQSSLAILTPYRKQVDLLRGRLGEFAQHVHTIDSFQGREADIVIASLVRDKDPRQQNGRSLVGHLQEPQRANVMLSRARNLLIVVGRMPLYARTGLPHWDSVVQTFAEEGVGLVVPASAVMDG